MIVGVGLPKGGVECHGVPCLHRVVLRVVVRAVVLGRAAVNAGVRVLFRIVVRAGVLVRAVVRAGGVDGCGGLW